MASINFSDQFKVKLARIEELSAHLQDKTDDLRDLLSDYELESSSPDDVLALIASRKSLLNDIFEHIKSLNHLLEQHKVSTPDFLMAEIETFRTRISESLQKTMACDQANKERIAHFSQSASQEFAKVKKGKKAVTTYDLIPASQIDIRRRGSIKVAEFLTSSHAELPLHFSGSICLFQALALAFIALKAMVVRTSPIRLRK